MFLTYQSSLKNTFLLISLAFTIGCASSNPASQKIYKPLDKVFLADYDLIWKAAHTVVKYPLANENQETGVMETESIRAVDGWQSPESAKEASNGLKYKLIIRMVRGVVNGRNSVKVSVQKKVDLQRDFFSDSETVGSDGYEEQMILYRIEREIIIERAIAKAQKT
ncbi:MAG: hypothetical protein V4736_14920 [Bdellovibrionota bacterium]